MPRPKEKLVNTAGRKNTEAKTQIKRTMSAAAARRRKQLAARKAAEGAGGGGDLVTQQLNKILSAKDDDNVIMDEASAYEALQLVQSQVKKKEHAGDYVGATDLAYKASISLLKKGRVSVASQLLNLMVEILRETHTAETDPQLDRVVELHRAHLAAMERASSDSTSTSSGTSMHGQEALRLHRLQQGGSVVELTLGGDEERQTGADHRANSPISCIWFVAIQRLVCLFEELNPF